MSQENEKSSLSQVLSLITPFDIKKIQKVKFYLKEFDDFFNRTEIKEDFRLQILKAKFVGIAHEKLVLDENLNCEKDYAKFKKKILDIFSKRESFTENSKQKSNQTVEEFNILAYKYFNMTGYENEKGAKDFFELIKINKFLDTLSLVIALELRKLDIKEYSKLCEKALQLENAFNSTIIEQVNNVSKNVENKDLVYENLLKQNKVQLDYISELSEQINE